jgi:hypothetical protein
VVAADCDISESMEIMTIDDHSDIDTTRDASPGVRLKTPPFVHLNTYDRLRANPDSMELSRSLRNPWTTIDETLDI